MDQVNPIFQLAFDLVNYTNRHLFLTGKAGTGKTTFLRSLKHSTHKNFAIAAPTGVAAINAGGTTLHSLLMLPFGMFLPDGLSSAPFSQHDPGVAVHDAHSLMTRIRLNTKKRKTIQALELLVIDEISMVRADLLDMVDTVLRSVRRSNKPFGGVQMLYIGDMFQLPPVLKDAEKPILLQHYKSPYFFDAKAIALAPPHYIELTHVYRQRETKYLNLLNEIRHNTLSDTGLELLEERYQPHFIPAAGEHFITLTTHNYIADGINGAALQMLESKPFTFKAEVEREFPEHAYPADEVLQLKEGAQVMFIKNDMQNPRRYFNGKIGEIIRISDDGIRVQCPDDNESILVAKESWENIKYEFDPVKKTVEEEIVGSFVQYPLRLAWAVTIHKSQGLTFDRAIVDAGRSFATGQVYVALSRCTNLAGLILRSRIHAGIVLNDNRVAVFGNKVRDNEGLQIQVEADKLSYIKASIVSMFEWQQTSIEAATLHAKLLNIRGLPNNNISAWYRQLIDLLQEINTVANTRLQAIAPTLNAASHLNNNLELHQLLATNCAPIVTLLGKPLQQIKASYPKGDVAEIFSAILEQWVFELEELIKRIEAKLAKLNVLATGYNEADLFANGIKQPLIEDNLPNDAKPNLARLPVKGETLLERLKNKINHMAKLENVKSYMIVNAKYIPKLAELMPITEGDLAKCPGFGEKSAANYGDEIVGVIIDWCTEKGIKPAPFPETAAPKPKVKKAPKGSTVTESVELWKQGKTPVEIAEIRGLVPSTILGHLAAAVANHSIPYDSFMSETQYATIAAAFPENYNTMDLKTLATNLNNEFNYVDLRMALAIAERKNTIPQMPNN